MIHQSFSNWQSCPAQGAIPPSSPLTPADEGYLLEVLTECRVKLKSALSTAQQYSKLSELHQAIGDAFTGCDDGLKILNDLETYVDV